MVKNQISLVIKWCYFVTFKNLSQLHFHQNVMDPVNVLVILGHNCWVNPTVSNQPESPDNLTK